MRREPRAYLWDVREAADNILELTRGIRIESYLEDLMLRSAVERQFEILGEAPFSPQPKNLHRNPRFSAAS